MKKLLLNNWQAKLTSLALAIALWYAIKQNVAAKVAVFFKQKFKEC